MKAPEGSTYVWTENPLGLNGYYLVSRGEKTPWRLKLRTASFNNISVLPEIVGGCLVGGGAGYFGASWAAGKAYDMFEETVFTPLPEVQAP